MTENEDCGHILIQDTLYIQKGIIFNVKIPIIHQLLIIEN